MKFFRRLAILLMFLLLLAAAYYLFYGPPVRVFQGQDQGTGKAFTSTEDFPARPPLPESDDRQGERSIALIIDDIGFNLGPLKELLKINSPLAFAVLPYAPHAVAAAELIHEQGREIMLHLPMEPRGGKEDPGPGALFRALPEVEIRKRVAEALAAVPYVVGANNHMGSAFMEDEEKLEIVLGELQSRGLFFIDSRTTSASRAGALAARSGIRFAARGLFLDNNQEQAVIFNNLLEHLEKTAQTNTVIIGHPYPGTVKALQEAIPLLRSRGIRFVAPSEIVKRSKKSNNQQE